MNIKKSIYMTYAFYRGHKFPQLYNKYLMEAQTEIDPNTTKKLLKDLLMHCLKSVKYYSQLMETIGNRDILENHPEKYLSMLPVLTKDIIRRNLKELRSNDLKHGKWYFNTSGGSTGEPIKLIQDRDFFDKTTATTLVYDRLVGREIGEAEVRLWGSEKEVLQGTMGWKVNFFNYLTNSTYLNAFRMSPEDMKNFILILNRIRPKVIVAYAQAIYELAKYAKQRQIEVISQNVIISSAGTLYSWMREMVEDVFKCKVYNRYGSREVGTIACESPGRDGLWVAPWANYVEIVDDEDNVLPCGAEGHILVTCLTNHAMPLIRYKIGDCGSIIPERCNSYEGQALSFVTGRNVDMFKTPRGTKIDGEYFTHLLYFKEWVKKFQVVQKSDSDIEFKIVKSNLEPEPGELDDIITKSQMVMGKDCNISFEFVDDILPSASGKYRYTISEVYE